MLSKTVLEALKVRDEMKAAGASAEDLDAGFERVIRDCWPKPKDRTTPWRYECEACSDTGLRVLVCRPGDRCNGISTRTDGPKDKPGKYTRLCVREAEYEHEYGTPCWCSKGSRFKDQPRQGDQDDFTAATKSKPRAPSRFGR